MQLSRIEVDEGEKNQLIDEAILMSYVIFVPMRQLHSNSKSTRTNQNSV